MNDKTKEKAVQVDWETASAASGTSQIALVERYVYDLLGTSFFHEGTSHDDQVKRVNAMLTLAQSLEPKDIIEAQLVAQMIAAHNTVMECIRRANISNQTFAGRDMAMKHAAKFMNIYMAQVKAFNKHRGKGDQKVVIEHVNVAPGGQAIVGNVTTGSQSRPQSTKAIQHTPDASADLLSQATKTNQKAKLPKSKK